jgi:hypothetical protein
VLQLLDESLEEFLRNVVPLERGEVDFAFDTPDSEWGAGITRPTVNLFLWDVRRSTEENESGREQVTVDGATRWQQRPPRVAFRYLCTAWTTEMADQHRLLGGMLVALLGHSQIPHEYLRGHLADLDPLPTLRIARPDGKDFAEFWPAVEGKLRAGLDLIVTATVDPAVTIPAGPPTVEFGTRVADRTEPARTSERKSVGGHLEDAAAVGVVVRSSRGSTRVGEAGHFLVPAEPGDEVVVETEPPLRGIVSADGQLELVPASG